MTVLLFRSGVEQGQARVGVDLPPNGPGVRVVIAQGAGAKMRRSLGVAVFSGMLGVTLFGIFLTPVFYYLIQRFLTKAP